MDKNNVLSGVLVVVVLLLIVITQYLVVNYTTGVLNAAVSFASSSQLGKLQACGVTVPQELFKLQADVPTLLLPAIYVGLPGLMLVIAILMFIAGNYYSNRSEERSSSETTTTTSDPNRSKQSGRFETGRHTEETKTKKSSESEGS
jgi:hypothetical protein